MKPITLFKCDLDSAAISAVAEVLASGQVAAGSHVSALEQEMSTYFGGRDVVALSDMTHALSLALRLSGVREEDDVLVLSYNCLSSTSAISAIGARPVWLDIDPDSASVTLAEVIRAYTPKTKAVVIYHVAGYPADLAPLKKWCDDLGVTLIEDANNALGARIGTTAIGCIGRFAVFSFYANRQVNAVEGAVLVCEDAVDAGKARRLRRFGIDVVGFRDSDGEINPAADVGLVGMSSSMTNVNAVMARTGFASLDARILQTRQNVKLLQQELQDVAGLRFVAIGSGVVPAYWTCLVLCEKRDKLLRDLKRDGVQCSKLHHPNHLYSGFDGPGRELPGTSLFMTQILALPCGWWLGMEELQYIINSIRNSLETVAHVSCNINHL